MDESPRPGGLKLLVAGLGIALRDALILSAASFGLGVLVNAAIHPEPIPFVAEEDYEILVPCPEPGGEVTPLEPGDAQIDAERTFRVDARSPEAFSAWHVDGAMNVTYDYLDPTPDEVIAELARRIARSKAQRVLVYGDGDDPDTGEQLGKEISGKGIKNVFFLRGGAPALRPAAGGGS